MKLDLVKFFAMKKGEAIRYSFAFNCRQFCSRVLFGIERGA